jgi:hypothetical protein
MIFYLRQMYRYPLIGFLVDSGNLTYCSYMIVHQIDACAQPRQPWDSERGERERAWGGEAGPVQEDHH